jgi:hypothetical protein
MLSEFLGGAIAFDLAESKYSVFGEYHKCLLHLWSSERNFVRRVLDAEVKATTLRLPVQRMGQNHPTRLDFCRAISAPPARAVRPVLPTNLVCAERSSGIFLAGPWSGSPAAWISNIPLVLPILADGCARGNARLPLWE